MKKLTWKELPLLLEQLQLDETKAGSALVVYHQGKCVVDTSIGNARADSKWTTDTLSLNFSAGKGVLATLIHCLVSQGLLDYDRPIAEYWSEFAVNGKQDINLALLMSHQSDLFAINSIITDIELMTDWQLMVDKVSAMLPTPPENKKDLVYSTAYNALVYGWVLGELIMRVTGLSIQQALDKYLAEPLAIKGQIFFGLPTEHVDNIAVPARLFQKESNNDDAKEQLAKTARRKPIIKPDSPKTLATYRQLNCYSEWQQLWYQLTGEDKESLTTAEINRLYFSPLLLNLNNYKSALMPNAKQNFDYYQEHVLEAVIPAVNGVASANALSKIYALLANKGSYQGHEFINKVTFERLTEIQSEGVDAVMPATAPDSMLWRIGYHRVFSRCHDVRHAFGHNGYNGSTAWCDPSRELAVAFVHNVDTTMLNDIRQFAVNEYILACAT